VPVPEVCLAGFRAAYRFDPASGSGEVAGSDAAAVTRTSERVNEALDRRPRTFAGAAEARARTSDAGFRDGVRAIRAWIEAGDVYQVNLSRRLDFEAVARDALPSLYAALAERAPAPFGAYLDAGDFALLSNSPERFLRVVGRRVETCPIKGTRPRGATPAQDRRLARELTRAPKDRAEHLMIVDLERNDLGRVAEIGSVRVERLAALRSFSTVHHLVSSVRAELRRGIGWHDLLAATFPSGSVTGAPKLRALEIIEALEPVRRGAYTGAFGRFDSAGGIDLALAIRTAVAARGRLHVHLGGGIVADSDADAELLETRDKGRAFAELLGARV
jgi:para-aminobenzoate synthetase component 1